MWEIEFNQSRRQRAYIQPIYLLKMKPYKNDFERHFEVVGTTNNIYTVKISEKKSCTCPDHVQNNHMCKHIYFIMCRVMKVTGNIKSKYKKDELTLMFKNIPHFLSEDLAYNNNTKKNYEKQFSSPNIQIKVIQKLDDCCPICLETIETNLSEIDYCKYGCGKSVHKICFGIWKNKNKSKNECLFCRKDWSKEIDENNENDDNDDNDEIAEIDDNEIDDNEINNNDEINNNNEINNNDFKSELKTLKLVELQNICNQNNLPKYGTKAKLIERITQNL
jgi:hypothetical protein